MNKTTKQALVAVAAGLMCIAQANAATYSYVFDTEFSGATPPAGSPPWASLSFSDVAAGVVKLELKLNPGTWYVSVFDFNFGPNPGTAASLSGLTFTSISGDTGTVQTPTPDVYKADGAGFFDLEITFPKSGNRFLAGETIVYHIAKTGISAADFNYVSTPSTKGAFSAALHAQQTGLDGEDSGWLGATPVTLVPEPETYAMLLAGLGLLGLARRRRERTARS